MRITVRPNTRVNINIIMSILNSFEEKSRKNVTLLTGAFKEMGNVFEEIDDNLSTIESKILMDDNSKLSVRNARLVGITQYKEFIKERFVTGEKSVHDVIKQNKVVTISKKIGNKKGYR